MKIVVKCFFKILFFVDFLQFLITVNSLYLIIYIVKPYFNYYWFIVSRLAIATILAINFLKERYKPCCCCVPDLLITVYLKLNILSSITFQIGNFFDENNRCTPCVPRATRISKYFQFLFTIYHRIARNRIPKAFLIGMLSYQCFSLFLL